VFEELKFEIWILITNIDSSFVIYRPLIKRLNYVALNGAMNAYMIKCTGLQLCVELLIGKVVPLQA
jgi:hypothetical protein